MIKVTLNTEEREELWHRDADRWVKDGTGGLVLYGGAIKVAEYAEGTWEHVQGVPQQASAEKLAEKRYRFNDRDHYDSLRSAIKHSIRQNREERAAEAATVMAALAARAWLVDRGLWGAVE